MLLIQVKRSRRGTTLVVVDPGGDAHACADPDELWDTVQDLLNDDFGSVASAPVLPAGKNGDPKSTSSGNGLVPRRTPTQAVRAEPKRQRVRVEEVPSGDGEPEGLSPFEAAMLGFVGEHGAEVASRAVGALRGMSHRGPTKKRRRRRE